MWSTFFENASMGVGDSLKMYGRLMWVFLHLFALHALSTWEKILICLLSVPMQVHLFAFPGNLLDSRDAIGRLEFTFCDVLARSAAFRQGFLTSEPNRNRCFATRTRGKKRKKEYCSKQRWRSLTTIWEATGGRVRLQAFVCHF